MIKRAKSPRALPILRKALLVASLAALPIQAPPTFVGLAPTESERLHARIRIIGLELLEMLRPIPAERMQNAVDVTVSDRRDYRPREIGEPSLETGGLIRLNEPSIWEHYKWHFIALVSFCIVEGLLLARLLTIRSRHRKAERTTERLASLAERRHLDEVVANVPGVVWETHTQPTTTNRQIQFVSQYVEKMLGYSVAEWLSAPGFWLSIIPEEDREAAARESAAILASGREGVQQFRWIAKDGRVLWVEAHMAPILDADGTSIGLRGATIDITDRKRAEEALKQSEGQLAGIIGSAMDAIVSVDDTQRIVLFNTAAERMFGLSASEALGQPLDRLIPNGHREKDQEYVRAFGQEGGAEEPIGRRALSFGRRINGEEFPIEASISQATLKDQKFHTVILRDITDRKQAEEAVRQSEERFRSVADTAPVMIWMSGKDKLSTYFNKRWLDFTGRTLEQEIGNGWTLGIRAEDRQRVLDNRLSAFARRGPFKIEYRLRRSDGTWRWIYDSGTPRFSSTGEFLGYIGSCIDITDRKEAEEALRDLGGRLIRAQEEERRRIARELHDDLNQRLALLLIELDRLRQALLDKHDELGASVQNLWTEAQEISLEIHRLSYDLHPTRLDHLGLVTTVKVFCEELSEWHGLKIEFRHHNVPTTLPKDVALCMFRIVQESLRNVIKHSGAAEAQVSLSAADHAIHLFVADSGMGFNSKSPEAKAGLGLVSMRERLRLVGGEISIHSQPSCGTRIDVRVPLADAAMSRAGST